MGVVSSVWRRLWGGLPEEVIRDAGEDPFLAQALQINEDIRTGKNRPLSPEEQRRFIERVKRGAR